MSAVDLSQAGVVYVATQVKWYLKEARWSAQSVKRHCPDLPVRLYTDFADEPAANRHPFDSVARPEYERISVQQGSLDLGGIWATGLLDKVRCLNEMPFEFNLYLDGDTQVRGPEVLQAFELLNDYDVAMIECTHRTSKSTRILDQRMFNGGVILFRRNDRTRALFRAWEQQTIDNFALTQEETLPDSCAVAALTDRDEQNWLLKNDQISLLPHLSPDNNPHGVRLKILDDRWNYRGEYPRPRGVVIDHRRPTRRWVNDLRNGWYALRDRVLGREAAAYSGS